MNVINDQIDDMHAREKIGRIRKTARICCCIMKILFSLYLVSYVLLLAIKVAMIANQQKPLSSDGIGDLTLALFTGLLALVLLGLAVSIFRTVANSSEVFHISIAKKIKLASIVLLGSSLIQTALSSSFISFVTMGSFEFGYATIGDSIPIDASGIVVAVVFYCLALVYEYGAYLQFISDNTV